MERRRLVASKLAAPPVRPGIVARPQLVDRLGAAGHVPVVLFSAPAGYGKTTLLALWAERNERPLAWVSLDRSDNDPVAFVASVITALDPILHLQDALDGLRSSEPPLEEEVLPALAEACVVAGEPFVLVLDDLHFVTERRCHAAIAYVADRLPLGCQIAVATRTDPPLPLPTWRAHGRLTELRAAELSLDEAEADAMLAAAGVHLPPDLVVRLVDRTEGWPAALYLAALSLRDRPDSADFVDRFAGTSRHVADFLSEDVLARQPAEVTSFLLHTCILDELTESLCDAVTEGANADAVLRELERTNLFVVPLDEDRRAYRYHRLFAEYLRAELARREPDVVPELHRRALRWYREHRLSGQAITHAQACGDVDTAAHLVAAEWPRMLDRGQIETLRTWLATLGDTQVERHAPLAIAAAWVAGLSGEGERAAHFMETAQAGSWDGPMPDGTVSLESALALMSTTFALGGLSGMRVAARRAVELEPAPGWGHTLALELLGVALTLEGDLVNARQPLEEVVQISGGRASVGSLTLAHLALVCHFERDGASAMRHGRRAHAIAERPGMRNFTPSVAAYAVLAFLSSLEGDLHGAAAAVDRAEELLPRLTAALWWLMIETRILLAPALVALGRRDQALHYMAEADELLADHDDAGNLPQWYADTARSLHLADRVRKPTSDGLSDAERRVLRLLNSNLTLREIGRELYLSLNTVKTHVRSIYRKLGVSSRTDAVAVAARVRSGAAGADSPG